MPPCDGPPARAPPLRRRRSPRRLSPERVYATGGLVELGRDLHCGPGCCRDGEHRVHRDQEAAPGVVMFHVCPSRRTTMPMTTAARATRRSGGLRRSSPSSPSSPSSLSSANRCPSRSGVIPTAAAAYPRWVTSSSGRCPRAQRDQIGCDDQPDADLADEEPDPRDALHGQATRAGRGQDRHDPEVDDHGDGHGRVHAVTLATRRSRRTRARPARARAPTATKAGSA